MFPSTASENYSFALELIAFLRTEIKNTNRRGEWSQRNFDLLRRFAERHSAVAYPSPSTETSERRAQFLWDFIAHTGEGILIAAESEFSDHPGGLKHDFEKLLYVASPVKLMLCRTDGAQSAEDTAKLLRSYMDKCCSRFAPGEVFVLYCVFWAADDGANRDIAFIMQVPGQSAHCAIGSAAFNPV